MTEIVRTPKKIKKKKSNQTTPSKIEKKPLSVQERRKKLRNDILRIARRYEEMRLYDEAVKYYKKLALEDDIERVTNIKNRTYIKKAREFEAQQKFEDAQRLYENLKMTDDVERLNRLMGNDDFVGEPAKAASESSEEIIDEIISDFEPAAKEVDDKKEQKEQEYLTPDEPKETVVHGGAMKIFKICPYCGEELNLPKKPNFCPYCKEAFV